MISFQPTADEQAIRDQVHRFAEADVRPHLRACEEQGVPDWLAERYLALGLGSATLPESVGGLGLSLVAALLLEEELAWGDPGVAVALPGPGVASYLLQRASTETQQAWVAATATTRTALAISQQGSHAGLQMRRDERGRARITGALPRVPYGPAADHLVVLACEGEQQLVLWLRNEPGRFRFEGPDVRLGLRCLPTYTMACSNTAVRQEEYLLSNPEARDAVCAAMVRIRLVGAAHAVGVARAATEYAARYALDRRAFGRPIAEHQVIGFMVADMAIDVDAARNLVWLAASEIDGGQAGAERTASLATKHAFEVAVEATSAAVQVLGGHGYVQDHPVEKWMRDARTLATW